MPLPLMTLEDPHQVAMGSVPKLTVSLCPMSERRHVHPPPVRSAGWGGIGIGVQEPTPSWGGMIRDGLEGLRTDPYLALFSSAALGVTILGFNLLGDGLRDLLDPRVGER